MTSEWLLTLKPTFLNEVKALDHKDVAEIYDKLSVLTEDPTHAPPVKKRLKHAGGLHRLRHKHYRVFYTYDKPYVSVLAIRKRAKAYDDELPEPEKLGGADVDDDDLDLDELPASDAPPKQPEWERWLDSQGAASGTPLQNRVTEELLERLEVNRGLWPNLLEVTTEEGLLDCPGVPEEVRMRVIDGLVARPLEQVRQQPDLLLGEPDDLIRFKEGELLGFLLRLNPEQEKLVGWAATAKGPTLVKGGPGTGKSTVALYRVRVLLRALREQGIDKPRLLFTTYTNALVQFSKQLLRQLLGEDAELVDVRTADSVAVGVLRDAGIQPAICQGKELSALLDQAIDEARFEGNSLVQAAQRQTIERLERSYLLDEVTGVIEGRRLRSLGEYLEAGRPGRQLGLNKTQREAVRRVYESLSRLLQAKGKLTWEGVRCRAIELLEGGATDQGYDGVVIDEAQDLSPAALGVLVRLCSAPNRLFLTADANQSIYGAGFRWSDVHDWLRFQGHTGILQANHRSTREIGEAAQAYLPGGVLDDERVEPQYVHSGPVPAVRAVSDPRDEAKLIARFFRSASRELRLGLGSCAVLCPTNSGGKRVAAALSEADVPAQFMEPKELDLGAPGAKTLTLKSAKGLEFPIVALAGFLDTRFPYMPAGLGDAEREELLSRERRTVFVAMTRAMRALLVVVPADDPGPLLNGFSKDHWNLA